MFISFESVTKQISSDYATRYAARSADALSAHIQKEIKLLALASGSADVIDWFEDEFDEAKKERAFEVFSGIVGQLYSYNLYIGLEGSLNEYRAEIGSPANSILPVDVLDFNDEIDAWYFECIHSNTMYVITVDIDHIMQRKRVWLNYKVEQDGVPYGVLCTGLEFSHIVGEVFSQYNRNNMRGLIIDRDGNIQMDSSLMEDNHFLYDEYTTNLHEAFTDTAMIETIEAHMIQVDGFWDVIGEPGVYNMTSGSYDFMTIAPIRHTDWSIVILSGTTTLFDTVYFSLIMIAILALLIAFAVASSLVSYHVLFKPLHNLDNSLAKLNEHTTDNIFGTERDDELGHLSNTIQD